MIVPPNMWFHQHFNSGTTPARYLAFKHEGVAIRNAQGVPKAWISRRVGGDQIDYLDEKPEIRQAVCHRTRQARHRLAHGCGLRQGRGGARRQDGVISPLPARGERESRAAPLCITLPAWLNRVRIVRIDQHGNLHALRAPAHAEAAAACYHLVDEKIDAGQHSRRLARLVTRPKPVFGDAEDDRYSRCRCFGRECSRRVAGVAITATWRRTRSANTAARYRNGPPASGTRPSRSGLRHSPFRSGLCGTRPHSARLASADPMRTNPTTGSAGCCARAASGHAMRRAAEKRDELAPPHSITSSASASSVAAPRGLASSPLSG